MHLPTSYFTLLTLSLLLSSSTLPVANGAAIRARQGDISKDTSPSPSSSHSTHSHSAHPSHSHSSNHTHSTHSHTHTSAHPSQATPFAAQAQGDEGDGAYGGGGGDGQSDGEERPHRSLRWNRSASATWTGGSGDWKTRTSWARPTGHPSSQGGSSDSEPGSYGGDDDNGEGFAKRSTPATQGPRRGRMQPPSHRRSRPSKRSPSDTQNQRSFSLSRRTPQPNFAETIGFNSRIARLMLQNRAAAKPKEQSSSPSSSSSSSSSAAAGKKKWARSKLALPPRKRGHYVVSGAASKGAKDKRSSSNRAKRAGNIGDAQDLIADRMSMEGLDTSGMPGTVAIMSHVDNSTTGRKLASLFMDHSNQGAGPYVLNASEKNATQLRLVPVSSSAGENSEYPVTLQTTLSNTHYCASYNPSPPQPEPLTMEPCLGTKSTTNQGGKEGGGSAKKSQTFSYNKDTGVIRPMWFVESVEAASVQEDADGEGDVEVPGEDTGDDGDDGELGGDEDVDADADGASESGVASSSSSSAASPASSTSEPGPTPTVQGLARGGGSSSSPPSSSHQGAQNVTLVFVPSTDASDFNDDDDEGKATKTVTVTSASFATPAAATSSRAVNVNNAVPSASSPSPSAPSGSATDAAAVTASPTADSSSATPSSSTLNVEVVSQAPDDASAQPTATSSSLSSSWVNQESATAMAGESSVTSLVYTTIPASSYYGAIAAAASSSAATPSSSEDASSVVAQATPSATSFASSSAVANAVASSSSSSFTESAAPPSPTESSTGGDTEPSTTMVAVVGRRATGPAGKVKRGVQMAVVDTEPYKWMFKAEKDR